MNFCLENLFTGEHIQIPIDDKYSKNGFGNQIIIYISYTFPFFLDYEPDPKLIETVPEEKFLSYIENNDINGFYSLIDSVNTSYRNGSAFKLAQINKKYEMLNILLKKNSDQCYYCLKYAVTESDVIFFKLFFIFVVDNKDVNIYQLLFYIAKYGNVDILKIFCSQIPLSDENKIFYEYALIVACITGRIGVIKFLEEIGVNLKSFNEELLSLASFNGHQEIVEFLLNRGLDIHRCNEKALVLALYCDEIEIVKLLIMNGANYHNDNDYPILVAASNGSLECVKLLLELDSELIHVRNSLPIILAAEHYWIDLKLVEYFIKMGADITCSDYHLWKIAVQQNKKNLVELLIKYGIDIHYNSDFAIKHVCIKGYTDLLKILLKTDPDLIIMKDELIQIAEKEYRIEIIECLEKNES